MLPCATREAHGPCQRTLCLRTKRTALAKLALVRSANASLASAVRPRHSRRKCPKDALGILARPPKKRPSLPLQARGV